MRQVEGSTSRRHGGLGLGLTLSKRLAGLPGGQIGVESEAGRGSRFWFTIEAPAARPRLAANSVPPVAFDPDFAQRHPMWILLVEDNPVNRRVAELMLERFGYKADSAENGRVALDRLAAHPYNLVFMDLQMPVPVGLEGASTLCLCAHRQRPAAGSRRVRGGGHARLRQQTVAASDTGRRVEAREHLARLVCQRRCVIPARRLRLLLTPVSFHRFP